MILEKCRGIPMVNKYKDTHEDENVDSDGSKFVRDYDPDEHQGGVESFGHYPAIIKERYQKHD